MQACRQHFKFFSHLPDITQEVKAAKEDLGIKEHAYRERS